MSDNAEKRAAPRFITPEAYADCLEFIRQAKAYIESHETAPPPDLSLLLTDARHGPFTDIGLTAGLLGRPLVSFGLTDRKATRPRRMDPTFFAGFRLLVGLGMGADLHDNGKGQSYLRLDIRPYGAVSHVYASRILWDAQPGQQVRGSGGFLDHRYLVHEAWAVRAETSLREEGVGLQASGAGREEALAAALLDFKHHAGAAGLPGTAAEYVAAIRSAFEMSDREHALRSRQSEPDAAE